jgi:hypothetical protein
MARQPERAWIILNQPKALDTIQRNIHKYA